MSEFSKLKNDGIFSGPLSSLAYDKPPFGRLEVRPNHFSFTRLTRCNAVFNQLNHPNLADDSGHFNLELGSAEFGQISAARSSDFGAVEPVRFFARIEF